MKAGSYCFRDTQCLELETLVMNGERRTEDADAPPQFQAGQASEVTVAAENLVVKMEAVEEAPERR